MEKVEEMLVEEIKKETREEEKEVVRKWEESVVEEEKVEMLEEGEEKEEEKEEKGGDGERGVEAGGEGGGAWHGRGRRGAGAQTHGCRPWWEGLTPSCSTPPGSCSWWRQRAGRCCGGGTCCRMATPTESDRTRACRLGWEGSSVRWAGQRAERLLDGQWTWIEQSENVTV